jgi:Phage portal protein
MGFIGSRTDNFLVLKSNAAREIALAFGVPPMLLGLPGDATYANYREANRALFRLAILPLAGKLLDAIGEGLRTWFPGATLTIDLDAVGALAEDRERLWAQVSGVDFLTLDEKRALVGYDAVVVPAVADSVAQPSADAPPTSEVKYNHNHDPDDGQFAFAGQGSSDGEGGTAQVAESRGVRGAKPRTLAKIKPKVDASARHFSASVAPTVENAITQIEVSKFGKTQAGKYVIDKIKRLHKAGKISMAISFDQNGKRFRAQRTPDGIIINTEMANHVSKIASELVHEATHDLLSDEYARTGRQPIGNSIDQEAMTNGYQLQLYREQRKYRFFDKALHDRLEASNLGKLHRDIRSRYGNAPEHQPKN